MREIADNFNVGRERDEYQNAAARFRLPFWDPFMPRNEISSESISKGEIWGLPRILSQENVWVKKWNAEKGEQPEYIPNPLQSFKFPEAKDLKAKGRIRWTDNDWKKWIQREDKTWAQVNRVVSFF